jgi:hypothetical protein
MNLREQLCSGTPLRFDSSALDKSRQIEAAWIEEAVEHKVRVSLEHAVVRGPLNLKYKCIEREFLFASCTIEGPADFSYATFKAVVDFSGSTFRLAPNFQSSFFQFDLLLTGTIFLQGDVHWSRAKVQQQLLAEGVIFKAEANAHFENCICGDSAMFTRAEFGGTADFSGIQIQGAGKFSGAVFCRLVSFENARIDGDLVFGVEPDGNRSGADFQAVANFKGVHVGQWANFRGAGFHDEALFVWGQVKGATSFGTDAQGLHAAWFAGTADFRDSGLTGDVDFEGVIFRSAAKFSSAHCGGTATFKSAEFHGAAEFDGIGSGEELIFENVHFSSTAVQAQFDNAAVHSGLFFSNAQFEGGASFEGLKVAGAVAQFCDTRFSEPTSFAVADFKGSTEFHRAQFLPESKPVFDGAHFAGGCSFDGAVFGAALCFRAAQFENEVSFQGVGFRQTADFSVTHFAGIARFERKRASEGAAGLPAAVFEAQVSFEHVRFERDARFDDTLFKGAVSFRETSFRVVYFSDNGRVGDRKQLEGALDLTGCTYDRIRADWKSLLDALHAYELLPEASYNRQPYAQLEKAYRTAGQDRAADDMYLKRRHVEAERLKADREPIAWFLDRFYLVLANYGVRPRQLILYAAIAIFLGSIAFHCPGSVQARKDASSTPPALECPLSSQKSLGVADSARLAFRYFLPVEVSLLANCEASTNYYWKLRFQDWAALLRVLGWVFVPVGIASLTGILRRVAP